MTDPACQIGRWSWWHALRGAKTTSMPHLLVIVEPCLLGRHQEYAITLTTAWWWDSPRSPKSIRFHPYFATIFVIPKLITRNQNKQIQEHRLILNFKSVGKDVRSSNWHEPCSCNLSKSHPCSRSSTKPSSWETWSRSEASHSKGVPKQSTTWKFVGFL